MLFAYEMRYTARAGIYACVVPAHRGHCVSPPKKLSESPPLTHFHHTAPNMKLHLPKQLFTALLAVITLAAPAAYALTIERTQEQVSIDTNTSETSVKYTLTDGSAIQYNSTDKILTLGSGLTSIELKFDLAYTAATSTTPFITLNWNNTNFTWGIGVKVDEDNNKYAAGWWNSLRTADTDTLASFDTDKNGTLESVTASFGATSGTSLTSSGGGVGDILTDGGLKSSGAQMTGVTLDSSVVTKLHFNAQTQTTVKSADESTVLKYSVVSENKVSAVAVDATIITDSTLQITPGSSNSNYESFKNNAGDIVVGGGAAQLYLQTWYDQSITTGNDIDLSGHDIYLGSSTNENGALRLGAWSGDITLGKVILIEDSSLEKEADANNHVLTIGSIEGDYTLDIKKIDTTTITGAVDVKGITTSGSSSISFNGTTTIDTLTINANTNFVFNGETTIGNTSIASGKTLDITGAFNIGTGITNAGILNLNAANGASTTYTMSKNGALVSGTGVIGVKDKVVLNISGHDGGTSVLKNQSIYVEAGGKLAISGDDTLGWGGTAVSVIKLTGAEGKLAQLELNNRQTMATDIILEGHTLISPIGTGTGDSQPGFNAYKTNGANITVRGINNEIKAALQPRSSFNIMVEESGSLLVSGQIRDVGSGAQGYDSNNQTGVTTVGAVVKSGAGEIEFSNAANTFTKTYYHQGGLTRISGSSSFNGGVEMTSGEFEVTGTATVAGLFNAAAATVSVGQNAQLTIGSTGGTQTHSIGKLTSAGALTVNGNLTLGASTAAETAHSVATFNTTGEIVVAGGVLTLTGATNLSAGSLVIDSGAGLLLAGKLTGNGQNITLNGNIGVAEGVVLSQVFEADTSAMSFSSGHEGGGASAISGYAAGEITYTIATGVSKGESCVEQDGISISADGVVTYVVTTEIDTTQFYVNESASWGAEGYTDAYAAHYIVAAGKEFDVKWTGNEHALAGKEVSLAYGATLTNTGAAADAKSMQLQSLTLHGSSTIDAAVDKEYGLSGDGQQETSLLLNGNTLTKTGKGAFLLINTTVNAGTIDIQEGSIQVGCDSGRKLTDASQAVITLSGGNISVNVGDTFKVAGLTGSSTGSKLSGWGNLELVGSDNYVTAAAVTGNMKLTVNMSNGASQTLHADSGWQKTTAGGATQMLMLNQGTLKLHLDEGASLNQTSIGRTNGLLELSGSGVYNLGTNTRPGYVSGLNQETWKGNVVIGDGKSTFEWNGLNFGNLGNANSKVTLQGVYAHLNDSGHGTNDVNALKDSAYGASTGVTPHQYTTNIELQNATVGGVKKVAFELDDGFSESIYEFCGKISGEGSMKWSKDGVTNQMWIFSGDVKDWTGQFYATGNQEQIIRFTDDATNIGTSVGVTTGHLNVQISNNADVVVNGIFSDKLTTLDGTGTGNGTLNLKIDNVNHTTSFNQNVDVDKLDITEGSTANFNSQVTVSNTVTNNGTLKLAQIVDNGETKETQERASISGGTMSKVQMNSTGISGTATDGTSSISAAEIEVLAADASFTIADMTLTNTSISVAETTTRVNLSNVSVAAGSAATLAKGAFAMQNQATVGIGGGEVDFTTSSYSGFTLGTADSKASITLNLGDLSQVKRMGPGVYESITILLDGFQMTEGNASIFFAADSWLGQLLSSQGANAYVSGSLDAPASVSEGGSSVSVSYSAATGDNVGTIITITGLNVPEPTTATLSLLALAALAARRRRK